MNGTVQAYDALILADPERFEEYVQLCSLYDSWADEMKYLDHCYAKADDEAEMKMMVIAKNGVTMKRAAITYAYVRRYSPYQVGTFVQLVKNNRVQGIGQIEHIEVARDAKQVESHKDMRAIKKNLHFHPGEFLTINNEYYPYTENEFLYYINHRENKKVIKSIKLAQIGNNVAYSKESPLRLVVKPSKMFTTCIVCGIANKPMVDSIIGGESQVICQDCNHIIRDLFGDAYTTKTLQFSDIKKAPHNDIILNYSQNR
jgi:hypothetical protein